MNINIQLFSFYQFDQNTFKLSTVNMHLIVLSDFVLEFFQKKAEFDYLLNVLIFIFFSHLLFKDLSTSINIWRKNFLKLCNESNIVTKELNSLFLLDDFIFIILFLETFKKLCDVIFIEMQSLWGSWSGHKYHVSNYWKYVERRWHARDMNKRRIFWW